MTPMPPDIDPLDNTARADTAPEDAAPEDAATEDAATQDATPDAAHDATSLNARISARAPTVKPRARFVPRLPESDGVPLEEWMLSYSDMVTLLLTMFVALLLTANFDPPQKGQGPGGKQAGGQEAGGQNGGGRPSGIQGLLSDLLQLRAMSPYAADEGYVAVAIGESKPETVANEKPAVIKELDFERIQQRQNVLAEVRAKLKAQQLDPFVSADVQGDGIRLNIPNSILFDSGAAELLGRGPAVLRALKPILETGNFAISVEGHTDSNEIHTERFPSNWELSAQRAATVVRALTEAGVTPQRLEAVGYADTRPLTGNDTEDGRRENRRVSIFLRM